MEIALESRMCSRIEDTAQSGKRSVFGDRGKKEYLLSWRYPWRQPMGKWKSQEFERKT